MPILSNKIKKVNGNTGGLQNLEKDAFPFTDKEVEENRRELFQFLGIEKSSSDVEQSKNERKEKKTTAPKETLNLREQLGPFKFTDEDIKSNKQSRKMFLKSSNGKDCEHSVFNSNGIENTSKKSAKSNKLNSVDGIVTMMGLKSDVEPSQVYSDQDVCGAHSSQSLTVVVKKATYIVTDGRVGFPPSGLYKNGKRNTETSSDRPTTINRYSQWSRTLLSQVTSYHRVDFRDECKEDQEKTDSFSKLCHSLVKQWL